jgi:DHA1 family multidrug resistance protein-like MFS transporter
MKPRAAVRSLVRREVIAVCAVAFMADVVMGTLNATFSLYAAGLGASLVFIGMLTSLSGAASLVASVPVGIISDRVGRVPVLFCGLASFALAMALFTVAPDPALLIPGRLLIGVALVATFWIAAAYLGDIVGTAERGLAFGLLTTAMGLGFTLGPLLGGEIAERASIRGAYALAVVAAVAGAVIVATQLRGGQVERDRRSRSLPSLRASLRVGRERPLIVAGIANILSAITFGGAIATIFPLYGSSLGLTAGTIGAMFAIRAIASTAVRLPSGAVTAAVGSGRVLIGSLIVQVVAVAGLGTAREFNAMLAWLILEGIGFGAFLTSAQSYLAEHTVEATRGAAIGFYSMTGGIGYTLAPLALGIVAERLGLGAVFFVTGGLGVMALAVMAGVWSRSPRAAVAAGPMEGRA